MSSLLPITFPPNLDMYESLSRHLKSWPPGQDSAKSSDHVPMYRHIWLYMVHWTGHLESFTPGTRQYKMVCTGTSQYVPYSIQGRTRNLKMVHTSTYQHRKFLWQYILVCTGMYCLVPAQYKVVQGGTRWYKMVQGGTNNGIWRYMEVQGRTRIV